MINLINNNMTTQKLTKFFEFENKEKEIHNKWDELELYKFNNENDNTFSIDTPPPTVSGYLHMGHVFSYVQCDIIARYNRIIGKNVFYPIGFDDNGLPTERLVEKQTGKKVGINCTKQEFENECYKIVDDVEKKFEELFRSIGISYDWSLKYQTISQKTQNIVLQSFADLYNKGLIYLKDAPVYWDVEDKTALAQADLEDKEMDSVEYYIPFTCSKTGKIVEIMTTRPELLVSCVAVLYHPDDKRFEGITELKTPIFQEKVPFLADETVKQDKGTGVVMCCSYGDWTDVEWVKKHNLTPKILMQQNGEIAHDFYKNQDNGRYLRITNARTKIVEELKKQNLIQKENKILHSVKCGERSSKPVEIINQKQMYVKILPFKEEFLNATQKLNFTPPYMKLRLEKWIEGLNQDWCISRNRFFGIEIPYYISEINGKSYEFIFPNGVENTTELKDVVKTENGYKAIYIGNIADLQNQQIELKFQYVFDTWFTSSLTPQIAKNSISGENLPFNLRPQAHEIIRTWTFYTLAKSVLHSNSIPWQNVALSGWCLASDKSKMSKSKGNVVDPFVLVKQYGADVIRYWCSNTPLGTDSAYSADRLEIGQKLTTKLWNCTKFILQNEVIKDFDTTKIICKEDLDIIQNLKNTIEQYKQELNKMKYFHARKVMDEFFWDIFCDRYLEDIKIRYYGINALIYKEKILTDEEIQKITLEQNSVMTTLMIVMKGIITLYSPFCPFICEEIQNILFKKEDSVSKISSLVEFEEVIRF